MTIKDAFTMAEVLITLAVIGIVAAVTIPSLITSYKKKVVETKLIKFYTTINEAIKLSEVDNGDKTTWDTFIDNTPEAKEQFYTQYFAKYLKTVKTDKANNNFILYFVDGSGMSMTFRERDYLYCIDAKSKYFSGDYSEFLGSNCFRFGFYPNLQETPACDKNYKDKGIEPYVPCYVTDDEGNTITFDETLLYKNASAAAKIIQLNDWKIPDDYPWKL